MDTNKRWTVKLAAQRLLTSPTKIRRLIEQGQLRAIDVTLSPESERKRYLILEEDLAAFEAKRATIKIVEPVEPKKAKRQQESIPNYFPKKG